MKQFLFSIALLAALLTISSASPREPAAVLASGLASPSAKPRYTVTDLGTLGGASEAHAISNNGKVAGMYNPGGGNRAFLWDDGVMTGLGTLGGNTSQARGVNDAGQVVGYSVTGSGHTHAFLWQNGAMQDLGTLAGGSISQAFAINNAGQVAGTSDTAAYQLHAFRWSGGLADLGVLPGGDNSWGNAINDNGQVAGASRVVLYPGTTTHAFRWSGGMSDLGALGWTHSYAFGMNDNGAVVGRLINADLSDWHAFLSQGGGMQDLGGTNSTALDINNDGLVVGESGLYPAQQAMLWENGQIKNLNSLINPGSGWVLQSARAINDKGQIVGMGTFNGATRAFLLKPSAYYWANPSGGSWHLATNWDPQGDPGDGDTVIFDLNGQYTVNATALASGHQGLAANAFSLDRMIIASTAYVELNNMDLNMVYDQPDDPSLQVNDGGTAAVNSGTSTFSHAVIGGAPPQNPASPPLARLQVLGSNTSLTGSGRLTVGEDGPGELFVTAGGKLTSAESRLGGVMPGVADVGGDGSFWQTGNIAVGYQVSGTLEIRNGGRVNSNDGYVGFGATSAESLVTVDGVFPGTGNASMWALQNGLIIGQGAMGFVEVLNGGDLYVTQDVQILNGSLTIDGRTPGNDPSDLDVLGSVFVGGPAPFSGLFLNNAADGVIEGNLILGQNGISGMVLDSDPALAEPTALRVQDPQAGLCAIGGMFEGDANIDAHSLLICRIIQLGGAGPNGKGTLGVDGGFLEAQEALRVGQDGGGAGLLELENNALILAKGVYIAPNGVVAGTGEFVVGSLGFFNDGTLSPGIKVKLPPAPPLAPMAISGARGAQTTMTITGTLTISPNGRIEIPVTGKNPGQYGSLAVTGAANLDGVLALKFSGGFAPKQGDTFTFLDIGGAVTGAFDKVKLKGLEPGFEYKLDVVNGQVTLEALNDGVPTGQVCTAKPAKPTQTLPKDGKTVKKPKVWLDWGESVCADSYRVLVREGAPQGRKVEKVKGLLETIHRTGALTRGQTYYWRASACNTFGCSKSPWRSFTIKP